MCVCSVACQQVQAAESVKPCGQRLADVSSVNLFHFDSYAAQFGQQQTQHHSTEHLQT